MGNLNEKSTDDKRLNACHDFGVRNFLEKKHFKKLGEFLYFFRGLRIIQFLFERPRVYQIGGTCLKQMYYSTLRLLKRLWKKVS